MEKEVLKEFESWLLVQIRYGSLEDEEQFIRVYERLQDIKKECEEIEKQDIRTSKNEKEI